MGIAPLTNKDTRLALALSAWSYVLGSYGRADPAGRCSVVPPDAVRLGQHDRIVVIDVAASRDHLDQNPVCGFRRAHEAVARIGDGGVRHAHIADSPDLSIRGGIVNATLPLASRHRRQRRVDKKGRLYRFLP